MKSVDIYYVRKEEKYGSSDMFWWNIRPEGCNYIDRYLAFDFKEAVKRYKIEHSIKNAKFIQE